MTNDPSEAALSVASQPTHRTADLARVLGGVLVFVLILAVGIYFRLVGLDWDEGAHLHPDERFLSLVESAIQPVGSVSEYFDTNHSTLNPNNQGHGFFVYGDFPVILVRYVGEWLGMASYYDVYLVGRALSAASDLLAVGLIALVARRLYNTRVALLTAALSAAAALPIQLSHFFAVDTYTNAFVVTAFLFAVRALDRHRWLDYIMFGVMLGLGMASKISVFPLALILILALGLRVARQWGELPVVPVVTDASVDRAARRHVIIVALIGLVVAGLMTMITFRVTQPYAFLPPLSGEPIDEEVLGGGMALFSRLADPIGMRPNPAWLAQMQEVRRQVTGHADIPPNHQWGKRLPVIFPWVNMVRVGLGWPFGVFCWLAWAWTLWEIGRGHRGALRHMLPVTWVTLFFGWQGIGWVKTMRYFLPVYPFLIMLAAWALVTFWDRIQALIAERRASRWHWSAMVSAGLTALVLIGAYAWAFAVSRIYTRPVTRVAASDWIFENVPSDVTFALQTDDGPRQYQFGLPNNWTPPDQPVDDPAQPMVAYTRIFPGDSGGHVFTLPFGGTLETVRLNHVVDPEGRQGMETLYVALATDPAGQNILTEGHIASDFEPVAGDARGRAYDVDLGPVELEAETKYYLILQPDLSGPLVFSGAAVATEGAWDDPLPLNAPGYITWGAQFQGYELQMHWEDVETKRERLQYVLDHTDYIFISSNRFYASMPRNPQRYPLTIEYYGALFSGDLGFELIGDFTSRPNLDAIEFKDDTAEEAWTVYDHPRVFVFHKTACYTSAHTAQTLARADLGKIVRVIAGEAKGRPVNIPLPDGAAQPERPLVEGDGLGEDASNAAPRDLYSRVQPFAVLIWWLVILFGGWVAFPFLFVVFPGLPDRGYGVAKVFALLFVAWFAWMAASLKIMTWGRGSILLAYLVLVVLSGWFAFRRRKQLVSWLREHTRHLLVTEAITLALFVSFLLVRLGNPDLWHPAYGGEKPMDMAYFNAVLKSLHFPPYDPWFAGETINYYYFGFVIVGAPVKLLGIPVSLAYNLILPTLFALTGVGAFSAALDLAAPDPRDEADVPPTKVTSESRREAPALWAVLRSWPRTSLSDVAAALRARRVGSRTTPNSRFGWHSYAAGVAALLLAVTLGNLDQIRTVLWGLAELGSGAQEYTSAVLPDLGHVARGLSITLSEDVPLPVGTGEWYWNATRLIPVPINENGHPTEVGPITEFPFFTFLYADLHAHMIAMSISMLAIVWAISQVRNAVHARKATTHGLSWTLALLNGGVGALAVGALRPTNTWDWPTYLVLGLGALMLAHLVRRRRGDSTPIDQVSASAPLRLDPYDVGTVAGVLWRMALFVGANVLLFWPYIHKYQLGYNRAVPWEGSRTPIWAYLDVHGLFLFLIISWLVWETWDWVRATRSSGRRTNRALILPAIGGLAAYAGFVAYLYSQGYVVAVIVLPLILWGVVLFFRPVQSPLKRAVLAMIALAMALTLVVEIVVLAGDIGRMNTVFKFYLQVWILLAVAAGAAFGWFLPALERAWRGIRVMWIVILAVLLFLAALYPLLATRAKVADRMASGVPVTLDGMVYMRYAERYEDGAVFSLAPDYQAIRWLQDNITGTPVVLEAHTVEYRWGSRVSIYTGLPSVVGWNWHQRQQRPWLSEEVFSRVADVDETYDTTDINRAAELLSQYNVEYIIVGELERVRYSAPGLIKFDIMVDQGLLEAVYDRDGTAIYHVLTDQAEG